MTVSVGHRGRGVPGWFALMGTEASLQPRALQFGSSPPAACGLYLSNHSQSLAWPSVCS